MALLNNQFPRIQSTVPASGSKDVSLTDPIKITFNTYMNQDTISANTIHLEIDGESYDTPDVLVNVEYDPTSKTATITPIDPLSPGVTYRIIVTRAVKSSLGVSPPIELNDHTFTTTTKGYLPPPKLLFPSNESLIAQQNPTFEWEEVDGATRYELELATDKNFQNVVWSSSDVVGTSISSGTSVDVGDNTPMFYYWRVRAYDDSSTPSAGEWSAKWVFNNASYTTDPVALVTYNLNIVGVSPGAGESLVDLDNRVITAVFDFDIDPDTVDDSTFFVKYRPVDGDPTIRKGTLAGTIDVEGNTIKFTADSDLVPNMEYVVTIKETIASTTGETPLEELVWTFTSDMVPRYVGVRLIRDDIGEFISDYSDDDINRMIHDVSKWADFIASAPYGEVIDYVSMKTNSEYYVGYARYETEVRLLNRKILEIAENQGKRKRLGDLEIQNDTSLVPDINIAIKPIQIKAKEMEQALRGSPKVRPRSVLKGGEYPLNSRRF